jgi:hypothetical protein
MFTAAQKYFATIPNGIHLVRLKRTMEQIKSFVGGKIVVILDKLPSFRSSLTAAVIVLGDRDGLQMVPVTIDLDEAAMKYEIFKQIIAPTKQALPEPGVARTESSPPGRGKGRRPSAKAPVALPQATEEKATNFAKDALKLNHPEFQKYVADLNMAFQPLEPLLADATAAQVLFLSSIRTAHILPLEILTPFMKFNIIYRDFSIMSAMTRKALSTEAPSFGQLN